MFGGGEISRGLRNDEEGSAIYRGLGWAWG